jgi:hypothetical protein
LDEVLSGDNEAWRAFVQQFEPQLRETVRETADPSQPLTDDQVDDLLADFWLRVVDDNMRLLRSFNRERGGSLLPWLKLHLCDTVTEQLRRLGIEPPTVPLSEARAVEDARKHVYVCRLLPANATERFIDALARIYGRRLLQTMKSAGQPPGTTIDYE